MSKKISDLIGEQERSCDRENQKLFELNVIGQNMSYEKMSINYLFECDWCKVILILFEFDWSIPKDKIICFF